AGQRLQRGGAELREVDARNRGQRRPCRVGATSATTTSGERPLDERLDVIVSDPALEALSRNLGEVHAELTRELAHRGAGVGARESRLVDGRQIAAIRGRNTQQR